jgi:hypothetical protein
MFSLTDSQLAHVAEVGAALFQGLPLQVSDGGLVTIRPREKEKELENDQRKEARSPTGSRERRQGARRATDPNAAELRRRDFLTRVTELRAHYSGVRVWNGDLNGTWLEVHSTPLGEGGPQARFLIAIPKNPNFQIRTWGFWFVDNAMVWIGPRHTNFPDGSICAFPVAEGYGDTLVSYVDLLAEWGFRNVYLATRGIWPGPQEGRWRYYRLNTTLPGECCPFCRSLTPYEKCCRPKDEAEAQITDKAEFLAEAGCDLGDRRPHDRLTDFVCSRRIGPPRLARVHPQIRAAKKVLWGWED